MFGGGSDSHCLRKILNDEKSDSVPHVRDLICWVFGYICALIGVLIDALAGSSSSELVCLLVGVLVDALFFLLLLFFFVVFIAGVGSLVDPFFKQFV